VQLANERPRKQERQRKREREREIEREREREREGEFSALFRTCAPLENKIERTRARAQRRDTGGIKGEKKKVEAETSELTGRSSSGGDVGDDDDDGGSGSG